MRGWLGRLWCDEQVMLFIAVLPMWIWIIMSGLDMSWSSYKVGYGCCGEGDWLSWS